MVPASRRTLMCYLLPPGVLVALMLAAVAYAESPSVDGWQFSRRVGAVELYRKPVAGSGFPSILAQVQFPASVEKIYPVLDNYSQFTGFIPNVLESRVIRRRGSTQWVYQRLGFPALVSDRHYIIQSTGHLDQPDWVTARIHWQLDRPATQGLGSGGVIPRDFSGSWELQSLPGNAGTQAFYRIHVDPGGRLPAWLFARLSENYVLRVMDAVMLRVSVQSSVNR